MSSGSDNQKKINDENTADDLVQQSETAPWAPQKGFDFSALERQDTAEYVEKVTADLCMMAMRSDLHFLAYLLDMARMEAFDRSNDVEVSEKKTVI